MSRVSQNSRKSAGLTLCLSLKGKDEQFGRRDHFYLHPERRLGRAIRDPNIVVNHSKIYPFSHKSYTFICLPTTHLNVGGCWISDSVSLIELELRCCKGCLCVRLFVLYLIPRRRWRNSNSQGQRRGLKCSVIKIRSYTERQS